jgi:hypothetical protein
VYIRYLIIFSGLMALINAKDAAGASYEELMGQSQFVFKGTVIKVNAATLPQIRPTASTIIVSIDEVLHLPPANLGDYKGKEVTVLLNRPGTAKTGEQFVFFTTSWMFGASIAVREVGRTEPVPDISMTRSRIAEAAATAAHSKLQNRVTSAEVVVAGRVVDVRPAPEQVRRGPLTEHDPHWWEAVIQIESVLKGQINERRLVILFPSSGDVMWQNAPKFREGQEGIWALRKEKMRTMPQTQEYFTALDRLDFHSNDQLDRIKQLIR